MQCCLGREKITKQNKGLIWNFSNGTTVISDSFMKAVSELERVNSKDFWASETNDGIWDVQLSDSVVVHDIKAKSVLEAVRIARWKNHLDKTFKKLTTCTVNNVF